MYVMFSINLLLLHGHSTKVFTDVFHFNNDWKQGIIKSADKENQSDYGKSM